MNPDLINQLIAQNEQLLALLQQASPQPASGEKEPQPLKPTKKLSEKEKQNQAIAAWYYKASAKMPLQLKQVLKQKLALKKIGV